jgi:hypothetical protein
MSKRIPSWRHWFSLSALAGLASVLYWVVLGIIGIAPLTESDLKWRLFALGGFLSLCTWYSLARASQKADSDDRQTDNLLLLAAQAADSGSMSVEQNTGLKTDLREFREAWERKEASKGVTVTPLPARLAFEGFPPTISTMSLDEEIRAKKAMVLAHLADDSDWRNNSVQTAARLHTQEAAPRAAVASQAAVNSGDTEFPTGEDGK